MKQFNRAFFRDLWTLSKPYWSVSDERWSARGLFALVIVLVLVGVYINYRVTNWYNSFYTDLQKYNAPGVWHGILVFLVLATIGILAGVFQTYFSQMLQIRWRRWLTSRYLDRWLSREIYYHMQILGDGTDNPDQRIAEDLDSFTQVTLGFIIGLIGSITTLVTFVALLWHLSAEAAIPWHGGKIAIPGYLVWAALVYSVIGTYLIAVVGRPLIRLNFNQERFQADFRFSLVRLRENSDSVALYGGETRERDQFLARFATLFANFWQIMRRTKRLGWWSSGYGQLAVIFPFVVALPGYLVKAFPLGTLIQISSAFGQIQGAFSFFASNYGALADWHAVVDRLRYFEQSMESIRTIQNTQFRIRRSVGPSLAVRNLDVRLPDETTLLAKVSFELHAGRRLLITGKSGSGKSTLVRTLAGIWPFGDGEIQIPEGDSILFLPQRPYLPLGTLRETVTYPRASTDIDEGRVIAALETADLVHLRGRLGETQMWMQVLSSGEQQRLAFARILLQHPSWIFMDEATSAVDEPGERALYEMLLREVPNAAVVSVGHRASLAAFHDVRFVLDGDGAWRTEDITR